MTASQKRSLLETYAKNRNDKKKVITKFEILEYYNQFFKESYPIRRQKQKFNK